MPLSGSLARFAWAGFRAVELFLPPSQSLPEPDFLARALKDADLSLAAIDAGELAGADESARLEAAAHVGRCAVLAQTLQANRVVCDLAISSEPDAQETIARLLAALGSVPVLLCLRNRPEDGLELQDRLLRLVDLDADRLGLALNPSAALRAGWDPVTEWPRLQPFVRHVYLTDAAGSAIVVPGSGDVRWEELADQMRRSDYSGAISLWLEQASALNDPLFAETELKEVRFLMESWFHDAI